MAVFSERLKEFSSDQLLNRTLMLIRFIEETVVELVEAIVTVRLLVVFAIRAMHGESLKELSSFLPLRLPLILSLSFRESLSGVAQR